jgi:hypothetical protein
MYIYIAPHPIGLMSINCPSTLKILKIKNQKSNADPPILTC